MDTLLYTIRSLLFLSAVIFLCCAEISDGIYAQQQTQSTSQTAGNPLGGFLPLILIFFIFYFLLIRPQQKRDKEHKKMLTLLKKGDNVITTGGIYGIVTQVKPDTAELKIDENTKIQVLKSAIGQVVTQANTQEPKN